MLGRRGVAVKRFAARAEACRAMDYGIKTAVRHLGIAGLLAALPPVVFGGDVIWFWIRSNLFFFVLFFATLLALGLLADAAVRREWMVSVLFFLRGSRPDSLHAKNITLPERLFLKWASCSRCVGYWWGGGFAFAAAASYLPAWFPGAFYFMPLGASLTTGVAVSSYLWRSARAEQSNPGATEWK